MIDDLGSYEVSNFISFVDEVYFRLVERQFEEWWPLHLLTMAAGVAVLFFAWPGKTRVIAVLLGLPLAVSALTFHFQLYAELTPIGRVFGWAFLIQIPLLFLWGFVTKSREKFRFTVPRAGGGVIAVLALAGYPFLILLTERDSTGAEVFGIAPDPTMAFVLGVLLMTARPIWFLLLFPIPLLWAVTSSSTLDVFEAPFAFLPVAISGAAVILGIWKAVRD